MKINLKDFRTSGNYPILMQCIKEPNRVVLFSSLNRGTVLNDSIRCAGHYSTAWVDIDDIKEWKIFEGPIELSND